MNESIHPLAKKTIVWYLAAASLVLILMMVFGVIMLMNQGNMISLTPQWFYKIMTAHGTGMIGIAALGGTAILWYFLSRYVKLNPAILIVNFALFFIGVAMVLIAIFVFHFSDGWTFLYPLPSQSAKLYGAAGALFFLSGMLILGIGFLILYMYLAARLTKVYGGLGKALGWDIIFRGKEGYGPPAAVVATAMVISPTRQLFWQEQRYSSPHF
ncbi:cbb3-type cytochrome c oxidase subunit I [Cytobacillus oceanisediminis]|uniref:cbb3-type cytochrome c oxidase subunit I n=1 Tax=Cytobacillus oceanisediminis TaxID=665099 RepID=UPI003735B7FA